MQLLALYVGLLATQTQNLGNFSMDKQATTYLANEVKASCCWDRWLSQKRKGQRGSSQWLPRGMEWTLADTGTYPVVLSDLRGAVTFPSFNKGSHCVSLSFVLRFGLGHFCVSQQEGRGAYVLLKNNFFRGGLTASVPSGYQETAENRTQCSRPRCLSPEVNTAHLQGWETLTRLKGMFVLSSVHNYHRSHTLNGYSRAIFCPSTHTHTPP